MKKIDAKILQKIFLAGAKNLEAKKEYINELNVFPVPDGDTGTNMTLTILSASDEVAKLENPTMQELAKAISTGSLRGARGNSGVILSQLFRGFTKEIAKYDEIDTKIMATAFQRAVETAYKAVMKPKEGTILTVAKGAKDKALEISSRTDDFIKFGEIVLSHTREVLNKTPDMLPVLKEAGVVDSGGQGLLEVLEGAYLSLQGKGIEVKITPVKKNNIKVETKEEVDIKFGYCTEFIIMLEKDFTEDMENEFKSYLMSIGDSLVVVSDEEIVKVHVHTNHPGLAFEKALTFGSLTKMKIDNMREEHQEKLIKDAEKIAKMENNLEEQVVEKQELKKYGFLSVSAGDGISKIFKELGVDYIIEGGQTMNPSTEDILNAIDKINAENIFILPNNKNIILASNQARDLTEDKNIIVVPTKTIPQGITAVINFNPSISNQENLENMLSEIKLVKTGQVTYAVRDTVIDGKEIYSGDIMGIDDKGISVVTKDINKTTIELIENLLDEESSLITIYCGKDISDEDKNNLSDELEEKFADYDIEMQIGGQPVYYYIVSVE